MWRYFWGWMCIGGQSQDLCNWSIRKMGPIYCIFGVEEGWWHATVTPHIQPNPTQLLQVGGEDHLALAGHENIPNRTLLGPRMPNATAARGVHTQTTSQSYQENMPHNNLFHAHVDLDMPHRPMLVHQHVYMCDHHGLPGCSYHDDWFACAIDLCLSLEASFRLLTWV